MNNKIAKNVNGVEISGIRKFYNKVQKYPGTLSLTLGQPDFFVPNRVKHSMIKAIEENKTAYTSNFGIDELREEISKYLRESFNIKYNKDEICLTIGGSEGLFSVFAALIETGDKVLIPTPAYPAYESCVKILGGEVVNYNLKDDFSIDYENLERVIREEHPKLIIVSYPSNPTGAVLSKDDKEKLYKILKDKEIIIISDEIYSALTFDEKYYSLAQYEDLKDRTILVSGFSKMFSMTGLRLGYVCAADNLMNGIIKVHQYNVSCAPSIVQWGALEGIKYCLDDVEKMKVEFIKRRDFVYNRLLELGFSVNMPNGAFYIFPNIENFNMSSEEFCERALSEGKVAVVPGNAFGKGGEGYIRISYSYSLDTLEEALNRLESFLKNI
ncbi:MAG: aminotransferase class I/II-fold pyridoxal phosphate-dependent enzyme [Clostridium sp.]|nr:aminotransferase class I/II-fold pyridoxal phosphate-dependent enzyme [Clostridium sp.]